MKATERFSIAVNPYARALDGSDRLEYSHMVFISREEGNDMDTKEDVIRQIMKHAVAGHSGEENGSYNSFCNDPEHAQAILRANNMLIRETFSKGPAYSAHPNIRSEAHA